MQSNYQENREIRNINKIVVKGSADVQFVPAAQSSMVVSGSCEESVKAIITEIVGDELHVESQGSGISISSSGDLTVTGNGNRVSIGGTRGSVTINGINITSMAGNNVVIGGSRAVVKISLPVTPDISVVGSADVELKGINQESLNLSISGSGDITAEGNVNRVSAVISGSGDISIRDLIARDAVFNVIGSGDIDGHATNSVDAKVVGSGDICVDGCPAQRRDEVVGSGKIRFRK